MSSGVQIDSMLPYRILWITGLATPRYSSTWLRQTRIVSAPAGEKSLPAQSSQGSASKGLAEELDRGGLAAAAGLGDLHANVLAGLEIVDPGTAQRRHMHEDILA